MYEDIKSLSQSEIEEFFGLLDSGQPIPRDKIIRFTITVSRMTEQDRTKIFDRLQGENPPSARNLTKL
jgi:hypothetical protein